MFAVTGGATDVTTYFKMRLTATGLEATGLTITDFDMQYTRSGDTPTAKVDAVALAAANTTHTDGRGIEIDATDQPGVYRFDWPDAAFAAGVKEVICTIKHASCFSEDLRVLIDAPTNPTKLNGTALTGRDIGASVLLSSGTGTGQVKLASGYVAPNWGDVGNPTTTVGLSGTTVKAVTDGVVLNAAGLATDAVQEIRDAITGGAYALDTDANGRIRIVDGTGTGELDTLSGTVLLRSANEQVLADWVNGGRLDLLLDATLADTNELQTNQGNWLTATGFSTHSAADVAVAVLDDAIANHLGAGSVGDAIYVAATRTVSTHSAADVWAAVTRTLTAIDEDSTTLDLDATIRAALGMAAASFDTDIAALPTQAEITGGAYPLDTDANGRMRLVDGTGAGELSLTSGLIDGITGTINTLDALDTTQDTQHATTQAAIDALPTNAELATALAGADDAVLAAIAALSIPTAAQNAAGLLDLADAIETGVTFRQATRAIAAKSAGLISGAGTGTEVIKGIGQASGGTTRLTATVDSSGNITVWTLNL